jgi:hypothetical protein
MSSLPSSRSSSPTILPPLSVLRASVLRDRYRADPVAWVHDRLHEHLWSKQREILESIRDHRRTAVYSCHRVGKSYLGGRLAFWWLDTHAPGEALVVTSAHSSTQVKMALWREMGRVHSKGHFPGRMNQTEYWIPLDNGAREEMVAFGRKPADEDYSAFQGTYAKYVLFILDEACYVPSPLWDGADTLIGNEFSRMVAFGNPDDPNTEFGDVCSPGSGWKTISIGYQDTPNFSGEDCPQEVKDLLIGPTWVEEKRRKWGEENPLYISKVLGRFPQTSSPDSLIPLHWIHAAQQRTLEPGLPNEIGEDVGGGGNRSVTCHRQGPVARIIARDHNPDTMQTLGSLMNSIAATGATTTRVDRVGIGWGMVNRAAEIAADIHELPPIRARAKSIIGVNVGDPSSNPQEFANLRAEGYWGLRETFQDGDIDLDPDDDDLAAQLVALKYKRTSRGQIQIESKEEMRRRGMPSPDDADALMLAFLKVTGKVGMTRATWGRKRRR